MQYKVPGIAGREDVWADCKISDRHVFRDTCGEEEEDYVVARMLPSDYSFHDALAFHIYLIVPMEYAAKSLRKKARLPE